MILHFFDVSNDQRNQLHKMSASGIFGLGVSVTIIAYLMRNSLSPFLLYFGLGLHLSILLFRLYILELHHKMSMKENAKWTLLFTIGAFLSGASWGGLAVVMNSMVSIEYQFILFATIIGLSSVGISTLGVVFISYLAFMLPMIIPIVIWLLMQNTEVYHIAALLSLIAIFFSL